MAIQQSQYEELLATYTDHYGMLALLKKVRVYMEMLPSMRRPLHSLITIPLPIVKVRESAPAGLSNASALAPGDAVQIPCDVAVLMCDPDWKIKTGVEIFVYIHRPQEDFSDLLGRWRQTQLWINKGYDWLMPSRYSHMFGEGAEESYPLFVIFPETPTRVRRGLEGAELPYVIEWVSPSKPSVDKNIDQNAQIDAIDSTDGDGTKSHSHSAFTHQMTDSVSTFGDSSLEIEPESEIESDSDADTSLSDSNVSP